MIPIDPGSNSDDTFGRETLGREPKHLSYGETALRSELNDLQDRDGDRRRHLYVSSLKMGSLVGGSELKYERAETSLLTLGRMTLQLPDRDVHKTVRAGLEKGMASPRHAPDWRTIKDRGDAVLHWLKWWESIDMIDLPGTRGASCHRLLAAFAIAGMTIGKIHIRFSVRQGAEGAGMSTSTAHALMKPGGMVESSGYLKVSGRRRRPGDMLSNRATTWQPLIKRRLPRQGHSPEYSASVLSRKTVLRSASSNVFHRRQNAWRIHGLLAIDEETTVPKLAGATGLTLATVRKNLHYLAHHNLASKVDRFHWRGTLASPDEVAVADDGIDHAANRRTRHARDRETFAKWRAVRAAAQEEEAERQDRERGLRIAEHERRQISVADPATGEVLSTQAEKPSHSLAGPEPGPAEAHAKSADAA